MNSAEPGHQLSWRRGTIRCSRVGTVRWRRVMVSVTLSAIAHLVALLWWSSPEEPVREPARPPPSEVAFDVVRSPSRPRKTVVVVVGPARAAAGGSPRGRDVGRLRALPRHNMSVSATAPPAPPPTVAAAAIEPPVEQGPSVPISDVTQTVPARSD